jgi:uncharacterized membrane protein YjdF
MSSWIMAVGAAAIWLDAIGNFAGWYTDFWWWDRLAHFCGGLALSVLAYDFWRTHKSAKVIPVGWLALATGQTIGAWYEISEFGGDILFGMHRVGSGYDSPRDLFFNFIGGVVGIMIYRFVIKRRKVV